MGLIQPRLQRRMGGKKMFKRVAIAVIVVFSLIAFAGISRAEEKFGIKVYPGAKLDEGSTKFIVEQLKQDGAAYRTSDPIEKVIAFYKGQSDIRAIALTKDGGMLKKGEDVDITIQNPWLDTKTGKLNNDTLISIVKNK
jgi:hypothetical protein